MDPITLNRIQSVAPTTKATTSAAVNKTSGAFGATLNNALDGLSQMQMTWTKRFKTGGGENVDLHQVMIAAEETDIAFRVALSMRDKLVEAYQEVMRMQV